MRSRLEPVTLGLVALAALAGCEFTNTRRQLNTAFLVGGYTGIARSSVGPDGSVAGGTARLEVAETDHDVHFTTWGHADLALAGNESGWAGQVSGELEFGLVPFKTPHNLFARGGAAGHFQRDPYTGYASVEIPTVTAGYQFHGTGGDDYADSLHVDLGVRGGLVAFERAYARRRESDVLGVPEAGTLATIMGEFGMIRASYMAILGSQVTHLAKTTTCLQWAVAVCVDTRHIYSAFIIGKERERVQTDYIGVSFGFGFSTGYGLDLD